MSAIDTSDKNHTSKQGRVQTKGGSETIGKERHHGVTERELHEDGVGSSGNFDKVSGFQGNTHGKHKSGKCACEILGSEPSERLWGFQSNAREKHRPEREESSGNISSLDVAIKDLLTRGLNLCWFTSISDTLMLYFKAKYNEKPIHHLLVSPQDRRLAPALTDMTKAVWEFFMYEGPDKDDDPTTCDSFYRFK